MKKKILALITIVAMLALLFSGCLSEIVEVNINADGSGSLRVRVGYDERVIIELDEANAAETIKSLEENPDVDKFTYNGHTYYGKIIEKDFANIEELDSLLNSTDAFDELDSDQKEELEELANSEIKLTKNADGSFTLTLSRKADKAVASGSENEELNEVDEEELKELLEAMTILMEFNLPAEVRQVSGSDAGISISGKHLSIDVVRVNVDDGDLVFTTSDSSASSEAAPKKSEDNGEKTETKPEKGDEGAKNPVSSEDKPEDAAPVFADVKSGDWFYEAVTAVCGKGVMRGMGNGKFEPNGKLTYAQFCTILSNMLGWDSSAAENSYWAYGAVEKALELGFVKDLGEIIPANYDAEITREAAIASMAKLVNTGAPANSFTLEDIPDHESISPEYAEDILRAYNYGVTSGVDENRTFNPTKTLTRAEISKLIFNVFLSE